MAHSKSSKKEFILDKETLAEIKPIKSRVKTFVKKVLAPVEANNVDYAKQHYM